MEGEKVIKEQHEDILEKYKKIDKLGLIKYKSEHFILVNSIEPLFKEKDYNWESGCIKRIVKEFKYLQKGLLYEGFQIYGIKKNKCIGVIEDLLKLHMKKVFFYLK